MHTRPRLPVDAVAAGGVLTPAQWPTCHAACAGEAPPPGRHQGSAIPPRPPVVTAEQGPQLGGAPGGAV